MTSKLRYEIKPRPLRSQRPGLTHMVVDNQRVLAVHFGTPESCEAWVLKHDIAKATIKR